jgi:hypothetical protein
MSEACFICGEDNPTVLQEHHVLPRRYGGGDSDENLVTLCANCHEAVEKIYDDSFYERAGYSTAPSSGRFDPEVAERWIVEFLEFSDAIERGGWVAKRRLYNMYVDWVAERERAPVPPHNVFGKILLNADRADVGSSQRRVDGSRTRVYTGIHTTD